MALIFRIIADHYHYLPSFYPESQCSVFLRSLTCLLHSNFILARFFIIIYICTSPCVSLISGLYLTSMSLDLVNGLSNITLFILACD